MFEQQFQIIRDNIRAGQEHLDAIQVEMARLEAAGMYPAVPTEQWQTRNGGDTRYLYMLFRMGCDGPKIGGTKR